MSATTTTAIRTALSAMSRDVVTCEPTATLKEALDLMTDNHLTGLPVVDDKGRCIGVVSASDVLGFEEEHVDELESVGDESARYFDQETQQWESIRPCAFSMEALDRTPVREVMTPRVVGCSPDAPLSTVAATMVEEGVHRVVVMDDDRHVQGIVSALDFVRIAAEA